MMISTDFWSDGRRKLYQQVEFLRCGVPSENVWMQIIAKARYQKGLTTKIQVRKNINKRGIGEFQ